MTRAITPSELSTLRAPSSSQLYLAIWQPTSIFAAQVNGTPSVTDGVIQIAYRDVTLGAYTDIKVGMTCLVGSSAGMSDKGIIRIRLAPSATMLFIGEVSDVNFADGDYLTVINEFSIWPRHIKMINGSWHIDGISYSDQHANFDPIPVMGPIATVLWKSGSTVSFSPSAADSWVPGSSITAYSHAAPGSSSLLNSDTSTPTITYDTCGQYLRSCQVTAANGNSHTGYRYVFVFDSAHMPISQFELVQPPAGSRDEGGWSFSVKMYDEAALADVKDGALCVLFSMDSPAAIGPDASHANILTIGWIDGESIEYSADVSSVTFDVFGPQRLLNNIPAFPVGLKDTTGTSSSWLFVPALTADKGLWHFLHWRCTASTI